MLERFLVPNGSFVNYTAEHFVSLTISIIFSVYVLYFGKKYWNPEKQRLYITWLLILAASTQIMKIVIKNYDGSFDITKDLPLHLCNLMPFVMVAVMWAKNRKWWAFFFFWIIAGSSQSLFTTSLTESFPHNEFIRYWVLHVIIVVAALYGAIVYRFDLQKKDIIHSWIGINIIAAIIYPINVALGANYFYLNAKPPGTTFYALLGPWPYYIISLEFAVLIIFSMVYYIFHFLKKTSQTTQAN
ncbi:MAG: TIGR02206 family membrane protein [Saprospiraceae bacterium]|nr:TIGR02206 family membrane protein [Saprospiraceae bacterium]MBK6566148.1 TIGR02206 family membrane protein [Saprospiraceae bacterium]MBK8080664.1 TIGR02206 family membrane protein [Saprospiraceae bacterium]MBK8369833.1 TIGR02206 family membrane protein [Saprospiraceae bacterium]MBK8855748.1 TIGR02206 family membrane protein [Saprospiraceae bacterium]